MLCPVVFWCISHTCKEKRKKRIKIGIIKEESNQANKQIHKWKWVLKTRLTTIQNQKHGGNAIWLKSTVKYEKITPDIQNKAQGGRKIIF